MSGAQVERFKRLTICCDGTWQSSNHGTRSIPSNVAKISRAIKADGTDGKGSWVPQIVYYDAGVGTGMGSLDKAYSGAFGEGLSENVCEAYNFLVNNYSNGDEIYIFGFSRGAYTARALAGLVGSVGICTNAMMDQFWEMYEAYCSKNPETDIQSTEWGKGDKGRDKKGWFSTEKWTGMGHGDVWLAKCAKVKIQVVGVFDTVGSLGWPDSDYLNLTRKNTKYGFHDTNIHPSIKNAFHALAIDEKRRPFSPTMWHTKKGLPTNLVQCWFPGVHINVGGGSSDGLKEIGKTEGDLESMANMTAAWMMDRVQEVSGLDFDLEATINIMDRYADGLQKAIDTQEQNTDPKKKPTVYRGWGVGPIVDSYSQQNLVARTVSGDKPRTPGQYLVEKKVDVNGKEEIRMVEEDMKEYIHPVVHHGRDSPFGPKSYQPSVLDGYKRIGVKDNENEKGYIYYKKVVPAEKPTWSQYGWSWVGYPANCAQERTITIREFVIPPEDKHQKFESLERKLIEATPLLQKRKNAGEKLTEKELKTLDMLMAEQKKAKEFLKALDEENKLAKPQI